MHRLWENIYTERKGCLIFIIRKNKHVCALYESLRNSEISPHRNHDINSPL